MSFVLRNSPICPCGGQLEVRTNINLKIYQYVCRGRCGQWRSPEQLTIVRQAQAVRQSQPA